MLEDLGYKIKNFPIGKLYDLLKYIMQILCGL